MNTNIKSKRAGETRAVAVYFGARLALDEALTGTPTVVELTTSDLTIDNIGTNSAERTIGGRVALTDEAVTFTVLGGVAGRSYTLRITATSDADAPQTLIEQITFRVN